MNRSRHSSLSQTMAQMRRRYNTRSNGGNAAPRSPYTPDGMPPVADAGDDQTVDVNTDVTFDGSGSRAHAGRTITSYSWDFGPDATPATGTGVRPSCSYSTHGEKTVTLTVTDSGGDTDSDTMTVTVSEAISLTLTGPDTVTRGDATRYTASIIPADLTLDATPTFNWKYTADIRGNTVRVTERIGATSQNPQTTTWSGTMVSGGTLEVRTTVNGTEYVQTMNVTVTDRAWVTEVPITTDTTSWGVEAPGQHSDLGDVEYDIPFTAADDLDAAAVSSGPNKGILYIVSLNLTAPFTVKINRHFGMADADLPPCWVAFKEANTRYGEIEAKVKARLGFDGTTSGTLYGSWESEIHFSDPKANLEEFMEVPGYLSYYETQIVNYVEYIRRTRKAGMARHISGWTPSGITINYNYFAADAGEDQTVDVDTDVTFDGSASCVPAGRTIESYSWDFGSDATPATGTGDKPSCSYSAHGEKTVTLTVTDSEDDTDSDTMTVTVKAPPVADAGDDQTVEFDSNTNSVRVDFDGSDSYDPDGGPLTYEWSFGDGSKDTGATPFHTYTAPGTYSVKLTVTDDEQVDASDTMTVAVKTPPVAVAGGDKEVYFNSTTNSVRVDFDGSKSHDPDDGTNPGDGIVSYGWSFGDGSTGSGATPSHTYTALGTYTAILTVTDNDEVDASDSLTVTVQPDPGVLTAEAGPNQTTCVGSTVNFDGSGSYAPVGRTIESYSWSFGSDATPASGTGVTPSCVYSTHGEKTVTLTVRDSGGDTDSDTLTVTVKAPPVADAGDDQTVELDSTTNSVRVDFDGSKSYDPDDGTNPGDGIVSYDWSFGDGDGSTGSGATPSHTYTSPGIYDVTLTVRDNEQVDASDTMTVAVKTPPVAVAGGDKEVYFNSTTNSVRVDFDGSKSHDPDDGTNPGDGIVSYVWSFGDEDDSTGSRATPSHSYTSTDSDATPSHSYTSTGTYTPILTVRDNDEVEASDNLTVTVKPDPGVLTAEAGPNQTTCVGSTVNFDGSGSFVPVGRTIERYSWDFGSDAIPATGSGVKSSCVYCAHGEKTVTLTVMDSGGDTDSDTMTVTVEPPRKMHHQYTKDGMKFDIPVGMMGIQYNHEVIADDVNGVPNNLKGAFHTIYTGEAYPDDPNNDISMYQACNRLHSYGHNFDENNRWGLTDCDFPIKTTDGKPDFVANRPLRNAIAWTNFVKAVAKTNTALCGGNLKCLISRPLLGLHAARGRGWSIAQISGYVGALIDGILDANVQDTVAGWYLSDDAVGEKIEGTDEYVFSIEELKAVLNAVQTVQRDKEVNWPFFWADPMDLGEYWTPSRTADDVPVQTFNAPPRLRSWIKAVPRDAHAVFMPYYYAWTAGSWDYGHLPPWRLWTKLMEALDATFPASDYPKLKFHPILDASKKLHVLNSDDEEADGIPETIRVNSELFPPGHADMHKQVRVLWNFLEESRRQRHPQPPRIEGIWFLGWNIDDGETAQRAIAHNNWTTNRRWAEAIQNEPYNTEAIEAAKPGVNGIFQNFPNPFSATENKRGGTRIPYHLAERTSFQIEIRDPSVTDRINEYYNDPNPELGYLDRILTEGYTETSPQGKFENSNSTEVARTRPENLLGGTSAYWNGTDYRGFYVDDGTYHAYLVVGTNRIGPIEINKGPNNN